jgi:hypothetical protein
VQADGHEMLARLYQKAKDYRRAEAELRVGSCLLLLAVMLAAAAGSWHVQGLCSWLPTLMLLRCPSMLPLMLRPMLPSNRCS